MGITIKDIDNTEKILKELKKFDRREIRAGFFGDKDAELPMIAAVQEYGAKIPVSDEMRKFFAANGYPLRAETQFFIIPERAFLRKTVDDDGAMTEVFEFGIENYNKTGSLESMVNAMGSKFVAKIQDSIASNIQPPNHPLTTELKGGKEKTLIDTGRLRQGVTYEVV